MDKKTTGIVAYLGWVGLIIAYCAGDKEGAKFHLNQAFVIFLFQLVPIATTILVIIPIIGWLLAIAGYIWSLFMFVCWILGLVAAINEEEKPVPIIGSIKILK